MNANQLNSFYMMAALALNRLITQEFNPFVPNAQIDFLKREKLIQLFFSPLCFSHHLRFRKYIKRTVALLIKQDHVEIKDIVKISLLITDINDDRDF